MTERTSKKEPIELAWDTFVESMADQKHGLTDAFKFAWNAASKREWVGLTDRELMDAIQIDDSPMEMGRKIEAKLKEKNHD